ncbi:unnamed protein product, partial [Candidula unifasciata]
VTKQKHPLSCSSEPSKQLTLTTAEITTARISISPLDTSSPARKQLLLVSYGRTGSSFTSAIISHDPDVFLIFEPLHVFNDDLHGDTVTKETQQRVFSVIDAYLRCDFGGLNQSLFADELLESSNSTKPLYNCLKNKEVSGYTHVECFLSTWYSCHRHKLTLIKTIRFRAEWAEYFLRRHHNLKILYLVRDVRAVLHSQAIHFQNSTRKEQAAENAADFCQKVFKDSQIFQQLSSKFPGRVQGVRYEHGCLDPEGYARAIYTFAGLNFTNITRRYLKEITKSNTTQETPMNPYSVVRQDSLQAMNNWRRVADYDVVKTIDTICRDVHSFLGYRPVRSLQDLVSDQWLVTPVSNGLFHWFTEKLTVTINNTSHAKG